MMENKLFANIRKTVKYLLFDLDGTLINDDRVMTIKHLELPQLLKKFNLQHSIISGRPFYMMLKEINQLQPTLPVIGSNGGSIIKKGKIIWEKTWPQPLGHNFLEDLLKLKLDFFLYTPTKIYVHPLHFSHADKWRHAIAQIEPKYQWIIKNFHDYIKLHDEPILKFLVCSDDYHPLDNLINTKYSKELTYARSTQLTNDVGLISINKGTGLQELMHQLNAKDDEFLVFGDGGNDLPMFKVAKYSVAIKNAPQFVQDEATFVSQYTNNEGGVYHCINEIWGSTSKNNL